MKILILGHKGYLGSYLHQYINSDVLIDRDVYNNGQKYDYIINCIGKVSLEYCQSNPQQSYKSNVQVVKDIITNFMIAGRDTTATALTWCIYVLCKDENQEIKLNQSDENMKRKELLIKALDNLNKREKDIFIKRCLDDPPSTLEKLSKIYNVSRERIRQIEVRGFEKVKKIVLETAIKENKETLIKKKISLTT